MKLVRHSILLLSALALLLCSACGKDETLNAVQVPEAIPLDGPAALTRLTDFLQRPWRAELRAHKDIAAAHMVLLQEQSKGFADKVRLQQLLGPPLPNVLRALEMLQPIGDRIFTLDKSFTACSAGLRVPPERPCPLRTRVETNWKRAREQAWKLVNDGLDEVRQGGDVTRLRVGVVALNDARNEAEQLATAAVTLLTSVEQVRGLVGTLEERLLSAKRRVAGLREDGDNAAADALESAARAVESALPELRVRAEACALSLACEEASAPAQSEELRTECDGLAAALRKP